MDITLKAALPEEIPAAIRTAAIYAVDYDLSPISAERVAGKLVVTNECCYTYENGRQMLAVPLAELRESECGKLFGSGCFKLKKSDGSAIIVAAFNLSLFYTFTALTQALDYWLEEREFPQKLEVERRFCPKCGYPLMHDSNLCMKCARKPSALLRLSEIGKPYLGKIIAAILLIMAVELLFLIFPYLNRIVIDRYIVPQRADFSRVFLLMGAALGIYLLAFLFEWIVGLLRNFMAASISQDLRRMMFEKIQRLSLADITKRSAGDMMGRIQNDTTRVRVFLVNYGTDILVRVFSLVVLTVILFVINWRLALLVVLPIPLVLWLLRRSTRIIHQKFKRTWHKREQADSILHDTINGIRVVKSYGSEENERKKFNSAAMQHAEQLSGAEKFWAFITPITGFIMTVGEFLVIYFAANMVLQDRIGLGELTQYTTYVTMLYGPLRWLIFLPRHLKQASVSTNKMFEILDEPEEAAGGTDGDIDLNGDIVFENVSFGYKEYSPVLKKLSFSVRQGEMIGIVGPSGVGKSTLINLLMRLYEPTRGKITINGVPLSDIPRQSLRSKIGVVLQETFLFDGTVLDNIRYAKPDASFEEILAASKAAGADEFVRKLPNAYYTRVGDRGYMLSGGERQRIAIARALLHHPKILILDEATSALDTKTEKQIQETLSKLIKGRTTFAIAHRLSTLRQADKLLVLEKGRIVEFGTHTELLKNKLTYYNLVMAQRQTAKIRK